MDDGTIVHLIGTCTKWGQGVFVEGKESPRVLPAIVHRWFRVYGPPKFIVSDQEGALCADEGAIWADRWKAALRPEPRGAHAPIVERRNGMLRKQYHRLRGQAREKGIRVTKQEILDKSLLALKCSASVHGSTPYAALFGRVPNVFKELTETGTGLEDEGGGALSGNVHRVRELSFMNIVQ